MFAVRYKRGCAIGCAELLLHDVRVLELHFITVSVFVTIICSDSKCVLMMLEREDPDIEMEISFGKHILTLMRISRELDCFLQHTSNDTVA